ncbi:alkyl hydroperoxide reductase subunit F [Methylophilaceae bacterium]|jgi:NADH-dependent peroxiredoxin subunit F|nr:alkyl hydroperoxide reductase subunit F [Methylophilaceae bacterium]MDB4137967.1 alkyl hydroperoxide reductase subunit F [Methylophilaceae bacterium]
MSLDIKIKEQLNQYLTKIESAVNIDAFTNKEKASETMLDLLKEISGMSDKVSLNIFDDSKERIPSFKVNKANESSGIQFAGIPMGHEFTSLVLALLQVGGYPVKISDEQIEQIKNIEGDFLFETYISLSCHNCPDVVQALNVLSLLNPGISHCMIDGALFQDEINTKKIMSVPTIHLNGKEFGQGRMDLEEIINKIDTKASDKAAEKISAMKPFDMLIVGGGPAGSSAAVYAARKGIRTGIVAERFGGQVMDTLGIENFISVKATEGPKLVAALEEHVKEYEVDIINLQRAKNLTKNENSNYIVELESGGTLESKSIIIATGARWKELGVPGEKEYKGKGVAYCPHCDGPLFKGRNVAVVGGGNSGIEAAIDLAGIVGHVTVLEFAPELKADQILVDRLKTLKNVDVLVNIQTNEIYGSDKVTHIKYMERSSKEEKQLNIEGIFIQIGLVPNTDWVNGALDLSKYGEIEINNNGATSLPGVFAAGDVTTVPYKQIIIAMGEGSKAALGAFDYLIRH